MLLVAAFAFGLALLAGLYAFGEVSGGHFNPAEPVPPVAEVLEDPAPRTPRTR